VTGELDERGVEYVSIRINTEDICMDRRSPVQFWVLDKQLQARNGFQRDVIGRFLLERLTENNEAGISPLPLEERMWLAVDDGDAADGAAGGTRAEEVPFEEDMEEIAFFDEAKAAKTAPLVGPARRRKESWESASDADDQSWSELSVASDPEAKAEFSEILAQGLVRRPHVPEAEVCPVSRVDDLQREAMQREREKKEMLEVVTPDLYRQLGVDLKPSTHSRLEALKQSKRKTRAEIVQERLARTASRISRRSKKAEGKGKGKA